MAISLASLQRGVSASPPILCVFEAAPVDESALAGVMRTLKANKGE